MTLPQEFLYPQLTEFCSVVSQATRIKILEEIRRHPRHGVQPGKIAKKLELTPSNVSHHIQLMELKQVVRCVRNGNRVYCFVDEIHWEQMCRMLTFLGKE